MGKSRNTSAPEKGASKYLGKLADRLFENPSEREAFVSSILEPKELPGAVIWVRGREKHHGFDALSAAKFQPDFVQRLSVDERPGKSRYYEEGSIYCLDFSSVFSAAVLSGISETKPNVILDLCASPGGKAVFSWCMFRPERLVCNEVIKKRLGALVGNLDRLKIAPAMVISEDVSRIKDAWQRSVPLVVVDAPCSGQSLLARGLKAPGCFHPATVNLNSNRQKRILASASYAVSPGGYLAYMTCTYSPEENEKIVEWFLKKMPQFEAVAVPRLESYQTSLLGHPAYRLFPQSSLGAGGFTVLFRCIEDEVRGEFNEEAFRVRWESDLASATE